MGVLDREQGGRENLEKAGFDLQTIFTRKELLETAKAREAPASPSPHGHPYPHPSGGPSVHPPRHHGPHPGLDPIHCGAPKRPVHCSWPWTWAGSAPFWSATRGELKKIKDMPCTTGMRAAASWLEGDRKTPEGVYFLQGKATGGLDFDSFGNTAYPLNYPNPVDRIQGKTGDGIMIHGRGRSFGPRQTLGCVVLENDDVDTLDRHVRIHATPVVIAESVT
jgi:hypothetical protein